MDEVQRKKRYVPVVVRFDTEGQLRPLTIEFEATFENFLLNANIVGWPIQEEMRSKYNCNIPWAILLDPTSACNLHCTGCWAAEYGNKLNLSLNEIDSIIQQGKELGVYMYIYTGGEPMVRTISYILTNPAYTGSTVWNKSFRSDTVPFPMVINSGQKPKYTVEDSHPAIIDQEDFQKVQNLIAIRKEQFTGNAHRTDSIYFKRVYCGKCGTVCRRKINSGKSYWVCNRHNTDRALCTASPVSETALTDALLHLHNKLVLHGQEILQPLLDQLRELRERELRSNSKLFDIDKEIANISGQNLVLIRLKSKGCIDSALALSQADEMNRKLRDLRRLRRKVMAAADGDALIQSTEAMMDYLDTAQWQDKATPELFENLVEQITVVSAEEVKFRLLNGLELTERLV